MTGEQFIPVPQQDVWRALNDPEVLKQCIAGCETIDRVSDTEYKVIMVASVGPVKAKFNGKLLLNDLNPPNSYSIAFEGSGGAAGFGKGGASVALSPQDGGTRLAYTAKASVGGKLAQVGSRLIDGVARKMADDFFVAFKKTVAPAGGTAPAASAAPAASVAPAAPAAAAPSAAVSSPAPAAAAAPRRAEPEPEAGGIHPIAVVAVTLVVMMIVYWALGTPKFV